MSAGIERSLVIFTVTRQQTILETAKDGDSRKVYSVSELTRVIKSALENAIGTVWLEGELSNVRRPASGHFYFTLKDENSQITCVLFRGSQGRVRFEPRDGIVVRAFGDVTVYERGGNYQLIVRQMEEGGKGDLQARFEALKEKLRKEGLFDRERKKAIPLLPGRVGVVTSRTGAAIRDILNVISRRFPNLHLLLAPVKVQGDGAAAEIAAAIELLNSLGAVDVMIIGRGGGSVEDLWCFNEEIVARAIAGSKIPVISAVGHEIDFTISDFVADLRAPTPSAAAELVVDRKEAFERMLADIHKTLQRTLRERLLRMRTRFLGAAQSYVFREPRNLVRQYRQRIDNAGTRMRHELLSSLHESSQFIDDSAVRTLHALRLRVESRRHDVRRLQAQLRSLNPLAVLERGYSVTRDMDGNVLRSAAEVKRGERLTTLLAKGTIESEVVNADNLSNTGTEDSS